MAKRETDSEDNTNGLTILGALAQLRDDIEKLQEENIKKGRAPLFQIVEGELELKLIAKRDVKGDAKGQARFRLWVVDVEAGVGGSGSSSTEHFQTLTIKFKGLAPKSAEQYTGIGFDTELSSPTGPTFETDAQKKSK